MPPVKGHILDFDENSNHYLVPVEIHKQFLEEWIITHKLNHKPEADDLLPGMIIVSDVDKLIITDYCIVD